MLKKLVFLLLLVLTASLAKAQSDDSTHLRISLLTCGTGPEIWETFGHTAIRVTDSVNGTDMVYNYGTFNGYNEDFELQFMRGKLLYYVSYYPYESFMEEYVSAHRSVQEQLLVTNGLSKIAIYSFLKHNALPENREYKYDFFFDNCATRIRDVFPYALGNKFKYANVVPPGNLTFRDIINQYFYIVHWERFGINILLGSRIDKVMTNADIMFLPDYLRDAMAGATVKGQKVVSDTKLLALGSERKSAGINQPMILMVVIMILTILGLTMPSLKVLGRVMTAILLGLTGLLGCLIVVMWLGTDHQGCQNNYNLLWALPSNLVLMFNSRKGKSRYALIAILLLMASLVVHILGVQHMPLYELWPLLLSLIFVYGTIYRRSTVKS